MSDDKADNITEPEAATTTEPQTATGAQPAEQANSKLADLMASGSATAPATKQKGGPDLEAEALRAAEQALAQGEAALADAQKELDRAAPKPQPQPAPSSGRELALRLLLAVNVLAMVIVALLPTPNSGAQPVEPVAPQHTGTATDTVAQPRRYNEPWNRALDAADRRDFAGAVAILEGYLADNPRMAPSQQLSTYMALSHYAARNGDIARSEEFSRRANALEQSHSLPEDLVAEAEAAMASGDQASLRRIWAQFLLQQRQIPSWLSKHVAEAYLQLGDSYRQDADDAGERARRDELQRAAEKLRAEAAATGGNEEKHR